jgi:mannitol 2-dehydrogenase
MSFVPVVADALKKKAAGRNNTKVDGMALVSALWCRCCQGTTETGEIIPPNDPVWDRLQVTAKQARTDPSRWLAMSDVYGDIGQHPVFVEAFEKAFNAIQKGGEEAAMKEYVQSVQQQIDSMLV